MRTSILTIATIAFIFSGITAKGADEKPVKSKIQEVTVFLNGAQVTRASKVSLKPGTNKLKFEDLSPNVNKNSIQVKGSKDFTILSVNHQMNYLNGAPTTNEIKVVKDSIEDLQFQLDLERSMRKVYTEEKEMLLANKSIKGSEDGLLIEDLQEMADYYRQRLRDIQYKLLEISTKEQKLKKHLSRLRNQLNELNYTNGRSTSEIIVAIKADQAVTAKIEVSFVVSGAGWIPVYDVRSEDSKGPVELTYKAQVYQNTGNDWENIKIKLSTGNPTESSTTPDLDPWVLQFQEEVYLRGARTNTTSNYVLDIEEPEEEVVFEDAYGDDISNDPSDAPAPNTTTLASYTNVTQSNVNTEFDVKIPYSIYSDNKKYDVEIQKHNLPATYNYFAAPKFDKDAFLLARVTGWDDLNLLSGNANIYYQGTFVGTSWMNTRNTADTLDISLGRDKSIVVDRKKIKDFTKKTNVGGSTKVTLGMEISIRNTKNGTVVVNLEDQIPISKNKEIEVETLETSDANYNEDTGKLHWRIILGPGETRTYVFKYQVKYPKGKGISNL